MNSQEYHSSIILPKNILFYHSSKIITPPKLLLNLPNRPFESRQSNAYFESLISVGLELLFETYKFDICLITLARKSPLYVAISTSTINLPIKATRANPNETLSRRAPF
jgi:hypothetical protein